MAPPFMAYWRDNPAGCPGKGKLLTTKKKEARQAHEWGSQALLSMISSKWNSRKGSTIVCQGPVVGERNDCQGGGGDWWGDGNTLGTQASHLSKLSELYTSNSYILESGYYTSIKLLKKANWGLACGPSDRVLAHHARGPTFIPSTTKILINI
jgi:hypothetical protein